MLSVFFKIFSNISNQLPLKTILIVPVIIQLIAVVSSVGWLSFRNGQQAVDDLTMQLKNEITARVQERLQDYLKVPHLVNQLNANAIEIGQLDLTNPLYRERFFWQQVKTFTSISNTYVGSSQGEFFGAKRLIDGTLQISLTDESTEGAMQYFVADTQGNRVQLMSIAPNYDPRLRPWYRAAVVAGEPTWSEIYLDFGTQSLAITAAQPFYDDSGQLRYVFGCDLFFNQVNEFLGRLKMGKHGQIFIMEKSGLLVTTSTRASLFKVKQAGNKERLQATASENVLIKLTAQHLQNHFGNFNSIDHSQMSHFNIDGARHLFQVTPLHDGRGLDWLIIVVFPEADFMERIDANTHSTLLLSLIALVIAILVSLVMARWIIHPIERLSHAAQQLAGGQWEQTLPVERSDELGQLARSFDTMTGQLKTSFETLAAKNAELQRLDQLKDEFLANTSHELRTPLNGIIGLSESLIEGIAGQLPQPALGHLSLIVASGQRLANLVNDILDFSKIKQKDIELQLKAIDMHTMVEVALTLSQPLVGRKKVQLVNVISPDLSPAHADENRVQQILLNLIGNAIKFTDQGAITVSAKIEFVPNQISPEEKLEIGESTVSKSTPWLAITVSDTGIGIPEEKLEQIFQPFEQVEGSTARTYGGTGLGLAVTKKLVELHGGQLRVQSNFGQGSQLTFTLPISKEPAQPTLMSSSWLSDHFLIDTSPESSTLLAPTSLLTSTPNDETQFSSFKILIVDDEPINLQVLVSHLSLQNYTIIQALSGSEALALLEEGLEPDAILLDVMMPRMSGYEVTKKIRERWQANELPILLLTAKNQVADLIVGLEMGANDYLTKPISKDELLARIKTHLNLKFLKAENLRMSAELEITRRLQQMVLPQQSELNEIEELEIAGFMEPAEEVGGDYYDVLQHNGRVMLGIGDVTGHGLESGVLMLMVQTAVRTLLINNVTELETFLNVVNCVVYDNLKRMNCWKNLTLSLLNYRRGVLTVSGQHEDIIVVRNNGHLELIDTIDLGLPIGIKKDISQFVMQIQVHLNPGEVVVLYTDGITEAKNLLGLEYGLEKLCEVVKNHWQFSVKEISQAIIDDVQQHIGEQKVTDDITLLVIKPKSSTKVNQLSQ